MNYSILQSREKVRNFVENKSFDFFIMFLICLDALVLGLMTSDEIDSYFGNVLFILDRLCMAIFIIEMTLKLYVYGSKFFDSRWNIFDFTVVFISSFSLTSYLIVLRTFRLFRLLRYFNRFLKLKRMLNVFGALLPSFVALLFVFGVFLYVFSIVAVSLFGSVFVEFSTLGNSLFALLQVFTLDGWASEIARPVMSIFPHSWIFFLAFLLVSFLLIISFLMSVLDELFHRDLLTEIAPACRVSDIKEPETEPKTVKKTRSPVKKRRMSPSKLAK